MWLLGSSPSKPASLTARNFSRTEPLTSTVPNMMPFLIRRRLPVLDDGSAATTCDGLTAATSPLAPASLRKDRRSRGLSMALNQFGASGHGHRRRIQLHVPGRVIGDQLVIEVHGLFPSDFLSGVSRRAAHDGHERAIAH